MERMWTPDALVLDADERPLMVVEVKGYLPHGSSPEEWLSERMLEIEPAVPFAMWVDPEQIRIWRWTGEALAGPMYTAETPTVLAGYDDTLHERPVYDSYLEALIIGWLRDLAYGWHSDTPPGAEALDALGIGTRLRGGRLLLPSLVPA